MPEESHSFAKARVRLEEIVSQVRKKDTSLEKSLDLLEEGVRLANQCTELIDHADWQAAMGGEDPDAGPAADDDPSEAAQASQQDAESPGEAGEDVPARTDAPDREPDTE